MKEEFNLVHDCDVKEEIDYISLGKAMKKIRTSAGITQEKAAAIFHVSRTVYTKYETGTVKPAGNPRPSSLAKWLCTRNSRPQASRLSAVSPSTLQW